MPNYDNTNSGALFTNNRKTQENHPSHTGTITTKCPSCGECTEWWLSAWVKSAKNGGKKFFSMALNPKEEQQKSSNFASPTKEQQEDFDDDIPF